MSIPLGFCCVTINAKSTNSSESPQMCPVISTLTSLLCGHTECGAEFTLPSLMSLTLSYKIFLFCSLFVLISLSYCFIFMFLSLGPLSITHPSLIFLNRTFKPPPISLRLSFLFSFTLIFPVFGLRWPPNPHTLVDEWTHAHALGNYLEGSVCRDKGVCGLTKLDPVDGLLNGGVEA